MSLISFIKSYWFLLFFFIIFITSIYCIKRKSYKILTTIISTYFFLLLSSGFFIFNQNKNKIEDPRKIILKKKAEALLIKPSSFLNYKDGSHSSEFLKYNSGDDKILFPLGSIPNKKIVMCEEDEGPIVKLSDRFGFFNKDELWNFKKHEILIIGDSHVMGSCVGDPHYKILNEKYNIKTIALGIGGNGPLITYSTAKEYLEDFSSNFIYYVISTNDFSYPNFSVLAIDLVREASNPVLLKTLKTDFTQGYFKKNSLNYLSNELFQYSKNFVSVYEQDKFNNKIIFLKELFSLRFLLRSVHNILVPIFKPGIRFLDTDHEKLLIETYKKTNELNVNKVVFIIKPNQNCLLRDSREYDYIRNILEKAEINKKNILDSRLELCNKKLWSTKGNHLNAEGYSILTEIIRNDYNLRINN